MVVVNRVIAEVMLRSGTLWRRVNENLSSKEFCEGSFKKSISQKTNIVFVKLLQARRRRWLTDLQNLNQYGECYFKLRKDNAAHFASLNKQKEAGTCKALWRCSSAEEVHKSMIINIDLMTIKRLCISDLSHNLFKWSGFDVWYFKTGRVLIRVVSWKQKH